MQHRIVSGIPATIPRDGRQNFDEWEKSSTYVHISSFFFLFELFAWNRGVASVSLFTHDAHETLARDARIAQNWYTPTIQPCCARRVKMKNQRLPTSKFLPKERASHIVPSVWNWFTHRGFLYTSIHTFRLTFYISFLLFSILTSYPTGKSPLFLLWIDTKRRTLGSGNFICIFHYYFRNMRNACAGTINASWKVSKDFEVKTIISPFVFNFEASAFRSRKEKDC